MCFGPYHVTLMGGRGHFKFFLALFISSSVLKIQKPNVPQKEKMRFAKSPKTKSKNVSGNPKIIVFAS